MADFIPVEEVRQILTVHLEMAEKVAEDFFREEWVDEPYTTMPLEDLEEVLGHTEKEGVVEVVEVTLGEVAGGQESTPVGEGEDLTTRAKINIISLATILGMVE